MTAANASATPDRVKEIAATLSELYPDRWALLLLPLCRRDCPHEHAGRACKSPGKVPVEGGWNVVAVARWRSGGDCTAYLRRIVQHLAAGGNVGLAVPPGVVVLDADTPDAVQWLACAVPDSPMQVTTRGAHFVVRVPDDLGTTAAAKIEIAPGIAVDVRAGGRSQIVCEPSVHARGAPYSWKCQLPEILEELPLCPPMILNAISAPKRNEGTGARDQKVGEGERNSYLFKFACGMRARGKSRQEIVGALREENSRHCAPPLSDGEVETIADSAGRYLAGARTHEHCSSALEDALAELIRG